MLFKVDQSAEIKWAMATQGLTAALAAHLNALYRVAGKEKYSEIIRQVWTEIGTGSAAGVKSLGLPVDNAKSVAEAGVTLCLCAMGPEYEIEQIEALKDRTVMKVTACPWKNRMDELTISHDLMSACDVVFWEQFVRSLNPNVKMRHGKQMHRGDAYCEWIFEARQ